MLCRIERPCVFNRPKQTLAMSESKYVSVAPQYLAQQVRNIRLMKLAFTDPDERADAIMNLFKADSTLGEQTTLYDYALLVASKDCEAAIAALKTVLEGRCLFVVTSVGFPHKHFVDVPLVVRYFDLGLTEHTLNYGVVRFQSKVAPQEMSTYLSNHRGDIVSMWLVSHGVERTTGFLDFDKQHYTLWVEDEKEGKQQLVSFTQCFPALDRRTMVAALEQFLVVGSADDASQCHPVKMPAK